MIPSAARRVVRVSVATVVALIAALAALVALAAPANADTVDYVLHLDGTVIDNTCNAEPVVVNGDLHIHVTHTPTSGGGEFVRSRTISEGLTGVGAVTGLPYRAKDLEVSFGYYAPPGGPSAFVDLHGDLLIPQGSRAPRMLAVFVIAETVSGDGAVSVLLDRTYTICWSRSSGSAVPAA
jgi:hypothetical protein